MATQVQLRRGNTSQTNAFTGAVAEITIDTDKETVVVHDGATAGGFALARESALTANSFSVTAAFNTANAAAVNAGTSVQREQLNTQTLDVVVARNQGICYCTGEGRNGGAPGCGCNIAR